MKRLFACLLFIQAVALLSVEVQANNQHKIRVLVGDSPITDFHIRQRANLMLMSSKDVTNRLRAVFKSKSTQARWKKYIQQNRPTSKEEVKQLQKKFVARLRRETQAGIASGLRKKALNELINEHLMINTAKANNIVISKALVDGRVTRIAKRNAKGKSDKEALKSFYSFLASRGVGRRTFRQRIKAAMAWQQVVRKKFGQEIRFSDRDVELQLGVDGDTDLNKKVEFNLKQIVIDLDKVKGESAIVEYHIRANNIRKRFTSCNNMKSLIAPYKNARVVNIGKKTLSELPSPINVIISNMKTGQITPAQFTDKGIELYAVCEREQVIVAAKKRAKVLTNLRQEAFQLRANRYLKDIRDEAHIEYRD